MYVFTIAVVTFKDKNNSINSLEKVAYFTQLLLQVLSYVHVCVNYCSASWGKS